MITFLGGAILDSDYNNITSKRKKTIVSCFIFIGLLPLLMFKYYNFPNESLTEGLGMCGLHFTLPGLNWAIPVGISFFTFQALVYLLDVYQR